MTERSSSNSLDRAELTRDIMEGGLCWAAIALGVFLRVFRFWEASLWLDEFGTAHVALAPNWATFLQRSLLEHHPPLHYLVVKFCLLFAHSEFFLRLPAVFFGVASVVMLILTVRRAVGMRGALFAGAIYALNTRAIVTVQDARMYGLAVFLTTASLYALIRVLEDPRLRWLVAYGLSTCLLSYSHVMYTMVLLVQVAAAAGFLLWWRPRPANVKRLLVAQLIVLATLAPLASWLASIRGSSRGVYGWIPRPGLEWLLDLLRWREIAFLVVVVPGVCIILWKQRSRLRSAELPAAMLGVLALLYASIWPAAVLVARLDIVNILLPRYLLPALFGFVILAGYCVQKTEEPFFRMGLWSYVGLCLCFQIMVAWFFGPWLSLQDQDWRAANHWLENRYQTGDVVLLRSGLTHIKTRSPSEPGVQDYLAAPVQGFYNHRSMRVFNLPLTAGELDSSPFTPPDVRLQICAAQRVFVLVNPQLDAWDWGRFEHWIGQSDHDPRLLDARTFKGLQLRQYRWERHDLAADSGSH